MGEMVMIDNDSQLKEINLQIKIYQSVRSKTQLRIFWKRSI